MNFTAALAGSQSLQESSFEGKMFEGCVFYRLKRCFCELIKDKRKVPLWKIPGTFGTIPVKARRQPVKVRALRNMEPGWAQGINNGCPVTINGQRVPV